MDPRRILIFIVAGFLAAYAWYRYDHRKPASFTPATEAKVSSDDIKTLAAVDAERVKLVDSVVSSVVSISSSAAVRQLPTLEDFINGQRRPNWRTTTSLGSGVIVSKEGHILTNHHVIAGKSEIQVVLTDGRKIAARLIGSDQATDIAVLKVEEKNLEPLPFGNSDDLRAGQEVIAVGNPYGFQGSVSRGIVSSNGRRMLSEDGVAFIQHDAAVNQGNSGGPLLNLRGEIVGINSRIFSTGGGGAWQGISFAIPAVTAREVMEKILRGGRYSLRYFGATRATFTKAMARQYGLDIPGGAILVEIAPNSPAARAGLQQLDIILNYNGQRVVDAESLDRAMSAVEGGKAAEVIFLRNGAERKTSATLVEVAPELPQGTGR